MAQNTTLLELVFTLSKRATTEAEVVATAVRLVNGGVVRLCGNFAGARIELPDAATESVAC